MHTQLYYLPRRVRRSLLPMDAPKPVGADEVCPHCGRGPVVPLDGRQEETMPVEPLVAVPQAPVEISKPKKTRAEALQN